MSDEITLTLPWKLAMHVKTLAHYERWTNPDCPPEMHVEWQAIIDAIDRQMLAAPADARANPCQDRQKSAQTGHNLLESDACNAPAEGPERAATGETLGAAMPAIIRALRAENPESWTLVEMVEAGAFPLTDAERAAVHALDVAIGGGGEDAGQ